MKRKFKKIAVGLSGGVDSAVSAYLLKKEGYDVTGIFLKTYEPPESYTGECFWKEDLAAAQRVAIFLDIPFETWNFEREYEAGVLKYFFSELKKGKTPNPDIICNTDIKFGIFLQTALKKGFDCVATGHYARIDTSQEFPVLLRGSDPSKDQSYFLARVNSQSFSRVIFPVGDLTKQEVRKTAKEIKLPNAQRPDSQGICFLGIQNVDDFIDHYLPQKPGKILDEKGLVLGDHRGLAHYTIGQREGIGIGGAGKPYYVAEKNVTANTLTVVNGNDHPQLFHSKVEIEDIEGYLPNWKDNKSFSVQIRYRQPAQKAFLSLNGASSGILTFSNKQRAVAPGQIACLYIGDKRAASAIIIKGLP